MSNVRAVLCTDTDSAKNPSLIGLAGEDLESQPWLRVFCSAEKAREYLRQSTNRLEVWVSSSDDIDAINLAAALRKDSRSHQICLLAFQDSGSLKSRANVAGIKHILSQLDFIQRYTQCKQSGVMQNPTALMPKLPNPEDTPSKQAVQFISNKEASGSISPKAQMSNMSSAHVLTVVSASGGSGKSTVSALAALCAQNLGFNTLLIDADMQFGDLHYFFSEEQALTIDKLALNHQLVSQLKAKDAQPALLAAPAHIEQSEQLGSAVTGLLDLLRPYFDLIVVNTGAFWADHHISLLEKSTTGLFLIDQHASSIRGCKHALDLCTRCGIATRPFLFAINHCTRNAPFTSIDVSCALQGAHVVELREGGREVTDLLSAGLIPDLAQSRNDLYQSVEDFLRDLLPKAEKSTKKAQGKAGGKRFRLSRKSRNVA